MASLEGAPEAASEYVIFEPHCSINFSSSYEIICSEVFGVRIMGWDAPSVNDDVACQVGRSRRVVALSPKLSNNHPVTVISVRPSERPRAARFLRRARIVGDVYI